MLRARQTNKLKLSCSKTPLKSFSYLVSKENKKSMSWGMNASRWSRQAYTNVCQRRSTVKESDSTRNLSSSIYLNLGSDWFTLVKLEAQIQIYLSKYLKKLQKSGRCPQAQSKKWGMYKRTKNKNRKKRKKLLKKWKKSNRTRKRMKVIGKVNKKKLQWLIIYKSSRLYLLKSRNLKLCPK